jgi:hypothetical protein
MYKKSATITKRIILHPPFFRLLFDESDGQDQGGRRIVPVEKAWRCERDRRRWHELLTGPGDRAGRLIPLIKPNSLAAMLAATTGSDVSCALFTRSLVPGILALLFLFFIFYIGDTIRPD